jgi:hypothetical protein
MKLTEAHIRKIIREELLKEMGMGDMPSEEEEGKIYPGHIAGGVGVAGVLLGINKILMDVQQGPIGADIAAKIGQVSDQVQAALQMLGLAQE